MSNLTVQEWQLLSFFEVEPELQDDAPWEYNIVNYTVHQGNRKLVFVLSTLYDDVRIILSDGETQIYEFSAKGIHDVRYVDDSGMETPHLYVDNIESVTMTLRIKPNILIEQGISRYRKTGHDSDEKPSN